MEKSKTAFQESVLPISLYFCYAFTLWMMLAFIPLHLDSLGFTHSQISLLISLFSLLPLLLAFPFGVFADRVSLKRLIIFSLGLLCLFSFLLRFPSHFGSLFLLFIIGGIGAFTFLISCSSLYYKTLGGSHRGRRLSLFYSIGQMGYALGPMLGGIIAAAWGMKALFLTVFLFSLPFLLLSQWLRDVKPIPFKLNYYKRDLARRDVLVLLSLTFLLSFHFGVERACLSLFLKHNIRVREDQIGLVFLVVGVILAGVTFLTGSLSDVRGSPKHYLLAGCLTSGIFNLAMLWANDFQSVLLVRILHVLGDSVFLITQRIAISNLFVSARLGGHLGLMSMVMTLGTFVGATLSGIIPGYRLPFGVGGLLGLFAGVLVLLTHPQFAPIPQPGTKEVTPP